MALGTQLVKKLATATVGLLALVVVPRRLSVATEPWQGPILDQRNLLEGIKTPQR
jgi:hypothetical protein